MKQMCFVPRNRILNFKQQLFYRVNALKRNLTEHSAEKIGTKSEIGASYTEKCCVRERMKEKLGTKNLILLVYTQN